MLHPVAMIPFAAQIIAKLHAISDSVHLRDRLTKVERRSLLAEVNLATPQLLEAVATSASVHGGVVAGLPFDADQARAAVARAAAAVGVVQWAEDFAQRFADDTLRDHAEVTRRAVRAYGMLTKYVQMPEGAAMLGEWEQMHQMVKAARKTRRGGKAVSAPTKAPTVIAPATPTPAATATAPTTTGAANAQVAQLEVLKTGT
ncbi:MAG: hypothetical protein ACHREM_19070 [Polyangiales bacterium]